MTGIARRMVLAGALSALALPAVSGDMTRLTGDEIEALLADRKVAGTWSGTPYTQTFSARGETLYVPEGGRPDAGRWRVNRADDLYESWWERSGWSRYTILRDGAGGLHWGDSAGKALEAFTLSPE